MELINLVTTDLTAITRGRAIPLEALEHHAKAGCGWVPANSALTPQGDIANPNPWGSHGDLRLIPDLQSRVHVRSTNKDHPDLHYVHGNLKTLDGQIWEACPRSVLADELEIYSRSLGWQVYSAFEHEFTLEGLKDEQAAFSLQAQRAAGHFLSTVADALKESGNEPETLLPEYGRFQYEVTCRPLIGIGSADRAINLREIIRDVATQQNLRASFTPQMTPDSVSNGVHLHLSFRDSQGEPILADNQDGNGLSLLGRQWAAGVLKYMPSLCAITAPTPVSYIRLKPHHWSSAYSCLGVRNREAALRICPTTSLSDTPQDRQFNLEFRALDATANPYLAMAMILKAGRLGIEKQLTLKACADQDPDSLSPEQRESLDIRALPATLQDALQALNDSSDLTSQLPSGLLTTYLALKKQELTDTRELSDQALCQQYAAIY